MRPITAVTALVAALLSIASAPALAAGGWDWPVRGQVVTQFKNGDDPYAAGQHRGVDIAAPVGTPVVAAVGGTVTYAGVVGSSGLTVAQRTGDDRYALSYLHLSTVSVRRGQTVSAGERLGAVGTSGARSLAQPHLHFGVREAGDHDAYIDPLRFLVAPPSVPESPRPVTAPLPVPVAAPPVPAPVIALAQAAAAAAGPATAPAAQPATGGAHAPAAQPGARQAPVHGPQLGAHPAPAATAAAAGAPVAGSTPAEARRAAPRGAGAPERAPHAPGTERVAAHGPRAGSETPAGGTGADRVDALPAADPRRSGGIDVGWLAACLGLIVAAALLAGPRAARRERGSARAVFATVLRAGSRG
jgi:hypothetical protein